MAKISPAEVQRYLGGMNYPATKDDLMNKARTSGAPQEMIDALQQLEQEEFGGPQDVTKALGEGGGEEEEGGGQSMGGEEGEEM